MLTILCFALTATRHAQLAQDCLRMRKGLKVVQSQNSHAHAWKHCMRVFRAPFEVKQIENVRIC